MLATLSCAAKKPVKKVVKQPRQNFTLIEAYSQRTLPGIPGADPVTNYHFVVRWETAAIPEAFFWRGENGFLVCNMEQVHKVDGKSRRNMPEGLEYTAEFITGDSVHSGDTLMFTSMRGGKYPVPKEIPVNAKNTLFYKTVGSKWLAYPVKTIGKKQDIAMP